jgi:P-type Ca2+ transporter type 2C
MYQYAIFHGGSEALTRTLVFTTLIFANIFLTLVNRSLYFSFLTPFRYKNNLLVGIIMITIGLLAMMLFVMPVTRFFQLTKPEWMDIARCAGVAAISVFWFEVFKWLKRKTSSQNPVLRTS